MNKAQQKQADKAAYKAKAEIAIAEAQAAAEAAFKAFAATANRTNDGHIADACGGAFVYARKPSYAFRTTLQALGEMTDGFQGRWSVSRFTHCVSDQSITASEVAARAALNVMKAHFPEEDLHMSSYID